LLALGENVQDLAALVTGSWRRLGQPERRRTIGRDPFIALDAVVAQAARGAAGDLGGAIADAVSGVRGDLPHVVAEVIARALGRVPALPAEAREQEDGGETDGERSLPVWLPPSRVLGGFYVLRPVGRGTAGSVFVVCRAEERHESGAERFALKVPSYGGSVAHTLSEEEFLRMFREEAGALLTLPAHQNLAGFVTFDARVRPRPILVMELVDGVTLDRALERGDLTLARAFRVLDGIAAGLEVMHAVGVGHLDIKPANVILRAQGEGRGGSGLMRLRDEQKMIVVEPADASSDGGVPVLVDFGLAGRKVRPGCASPFYGAPEVWVTETAGPDAVPTAADVYSFSCLAYELVTGTRLFSGETLPAVVAAHFGHDGNPAGLGPLRANPRFNPFAEWLAAGLRPNPRRRPSITEMRAGLTQVAADLVNSAITPVASEAAS
jgi:serine/threonine protein kinase